MFKLEEIYDLNELSSDIVSNYCSMFEKFNNVVLYKEKNAGTDENNTNEEYHKLKKSFIEEIVQIIRIEEKQFDYTKLKEKYKQEKFWEEVEGRVKRETHLFLQTKIIRRMKDKEREKLYADFFNLMYFEGAGINYVCSELNISREVAYVLDSVREFCEDYILLRGCSIKIFQKEANILFGLVDIDVDFLWNQYRNASEQVEKKVLYKRLYNIERRLYGLAKDMQYVDEMTENIAEILIDMISQEE